MIISLLLIAMLALLLGSAGLIYEFHRLQRRGFFLRGMQKVLYSVVVPRRGAPGKEDTPQEYLKQAAQFFSSLSGLREQRLLKRVLLGNPSISFEIANQRIGEQIHFYFAAPRSFAEGLEKLILSYWPSAIVRQIRDYNIFHPEGAAVAAVGELGRQDMIPLKATEEFGVDPLSALTNVFTKLHHTQEGAAVQLLIRPSRVNAKKMGDGMIQAIRAGNLAAAERETTRSTLVRGGAFFLDVLLALFGKGDGASGERQGDYQPTHAEEELVQAIAWKVQEHPFDVNLRLLASAPDEHRALQILEHLQSAFQQFHAAGRNGFRLRVLKGRKRKKLFYHFSFRIFDHTHSFILSAPEIASVFHFPFPDLQTPFVARAQAREAPPPANLPEQGIILGENAYRGEERTVRMLPEDRMRHFYMVGQTGTGKSGLLSEMIRQDLEEGRGVALIDPHGDLAQKALGLVPPERAEDVIFFDPADPERAPGLNMLEYDPAFPESKTFIVNEMMEILGKLYNLEEVGGPVFEQYMRNALLLLMEHPESGSTLAEVPRILTDEAFRRFKLSKSGNVVVNNFWAKEAEKTGGESSLANVAPYITSKLNMFIANDLMRPIISQQHSSFDFAKVLNEGKILIADLSKGKLGELNSYLLGMILVARLMNATFARATLPEHTRSPFFLYVDEFQNVTTKTIASALAEARKYQLAMILAHQYIGQLDEDTRKGVYGNIGSLLAFRVGPEDAQYLKIQFEPVFDESDLVNFANFNAAVRLLIGGERTDPFNLVTRPPREGDQERAEEVRQRSRARHTRERSEVEQELGARLQTDFETARATPADGRQARLVKLEEIQTEFMRLYGVEEQDLPPEAKTRLEAKKQEIEEEHGKTLRAAGKVDQG